ncbi:MAG: VanZ family protein [Actinomycetota bacterium]
MANRRSLVLAIAGAWIVVVVVLGVTERRRIVGLPVSWSEPLQHVVSFAVLGALLALVVPGRRRWIVVGLVGAGLLGEVLQLATDDRTFALSDLAFDAVGAVVGVGLVELIGRGPRAGNGIVASALVLLAAAPFLLVVDERPDTSFPDACGDPPRIAPDGSPDPAVIFSVDSDGSELVDVGDVSASEIRRRVVATDELSLEVVFSTTDLEQQGPARVFTISGGILEDQVNVHVGVTDDDLSVRLRTSCEWFNNIQVDDVVESGVAHTVVVTWGGGVLETWVDGESVDRSELDWGDLSSWDPTFAVVVGNEVSGDRPFVGDVSSITMWDRALSPSMITARLTDS